MKQFSAPKLANRVVVVTGASVGIGRAIATAFVSVGAKVVLAARNSQRLESVAADLERQFPTHTLSHACDVTDPVQVEQLMAATVNRFGQLDILINNAGIGLIAPFEQIQPTDAQVLFRTNFFGPVHCLQAALPYFKRQHRGHVVNIASLAGLRGIPNSSVYAATKAALIALSDSLRLEWRDYGIDVTTICPGRVRLMDTGFFETAKKYGPVALYHAPEISADAVAWAVVKAVVARKRLVVLPSHARLTYWANIFTPRLLDCLLYQKMPRPKITTP